MNVTALVNTDAGVAERYMYDPYGKVIILNGAYGADDDVNNETVFEWDEDGDRLSDVANDILYCGYRNDPQTGLFHVRNRYHDPFLGRFISRDPAGYQDGMSLYEYCRSGPISGADPFGHETRHGIVVSRASAEAINRKRKELAESKESARRALSVIAQQLGRWRYGLDIPSEFYEKMAPYEKEYKEWQKRARWYPFCDTGGLTLPETKRECEWAMIRMEHAGEWFSREVLARPQQVLMEDAGEIQEMHPGLDVTRELEMAYHNACVMTHEGLYSGLTEVTMEDFFTALQVYLGGKALVRGLESAGARLATVRTGRASAIMASPADEIAAAGAARSRGYTIREVRSRWWGGKAPWRTNPLMPQGREYMELSHIYISNKGPIGRLMPDVIKNRGWNLRPLWGSQHALVDPARYRFMPPAWKAANPLSIAPLRVWQRMPLSHRIVVGGSAAAGGSYFIYEVADE